MTPSTPSDLEISLSAGNPVPCDPRRPVTPAALPGHMAWFGLGGWGVGRGRDEQQPVQTSVAGFGDDMRTFIDTAQISVFGVDQDRRVNVWNSRVEELMGRPASDVMGKRLVDVVSEGNQTPAETRNEVWCSTSLATLPCAPYKLLLLHVCSSLLIYQIVDPFNRVLSA